MAMSVQQQRNMEEYLEQHQMFDEYKSKALAGATDNASAQRS